MTVLDFKVGDLVRVRAARRRDVDFSVVEVTESHVRARREGDRGGEAIYGPEAFEHVAPLATPQSQAIAEQPIATSTASADFVAPLRPATETSTANGRQTQQRAPFDASVECRDQVIVRPFAGEPLESLLKRFKKAVAAGGILAEYRARQHFIPETQRRRETSASARARRAKAGLT